MRSQRWVGFVLILPLCFGIAACGGGKAAIARLAERYSISISEAKVLVGASVDGIAESRAAQWLQRLDEGLSQDEFKASCNLLAEMADIPSPRPQTGNDARKLLQFVSGHSDKDPVAARLKGQLTAFLTTQPGRALEGTTVSTFRLVYCS